MVASYQHPSNVRVCILVLKGLFPCHIKVFFPKLSSSRIHYCYIILKNVAGEKKFVLFSSLRISDPFLLGDPRTSYQPA